MATDLILAIVHHVLVFGIAALLVAELVLVLRRLDTSGVRLLARLDMGFGAAAGAVLIVGFLRVFLGAKPESHYLESPFFWAKIAAFAAVGLISIIPTLRFAAWGRAASSDATFMPPAGELAKVQRLVMLEGVVFVAIPVFAAVMARA